MNIDHKEALRFVNEMERLQKQGFLPTPGDYEALREILTTPRQPTLPNYGAVR